MLLAPTANPSRAAKSLKRHVNALRQTGLRSPTLVRLAPTAPCGHISAVRRPPLSARSRRSSSSVFSRFVVRLSGGEAQPHRLGAADGPFAERQIGFALDHRTQAL